MDELVQMLLSRRIITEHGCWVFKPIKKKNWADVYGRVSVNGEKIRVHRLSYQVFKGKIPRDLVIDHKCVNALCFNPNHLQAITQKKNLYLKYRRRQAKNE